MQRCVRNSSMIRQKFVVIDTEGSDLPTEIAILDQAGDTIYHAAISTDSSQASSQASSHLNSPINIQSLKQMGAEFLKLTEDCVIVCHYAQHDRQVLQRAFQQVGMAWRRSLKFVCTVELAQRCLPDLPSYSLEYLSKKLHLQVQGQYFNTRQAHSARYDAEFTYQLYCQLLAMTSTKLNPNSFNPFSSSRVDTPFQDHPDQKQIYQPEFNLLKATIQEIRQDNNHQSRGAVLVGEAGSGKTHLIMRLAKELLQVNRLLFVRSPNHTDSVLHHIYSRILESLIEKVPENGYTQLENLLAHSFVKLISSSRSINPIKNDQIILSAVKDNPLNLYQLAAEGTEKKRAIWQHIERRTNEWWANEYGFAGYSAQIIKGILKFCSYSDPKRKQLVTRWLAANDLDHEDLERIGLSHWNEDVSKEAFSLEAIAVLSKLSLLDEPLIIVFDQLEALGYEHNKLLLLNFGEAVKELFTHVPNSLIILNLFPDRWQQFQQFFEAAVVDRISQTQIFLKRPSNTEIREILQIKAESAGLLLDQFFTSSELQQVLNQPSIRKALNWASDYYRQKVDGIPLPGNPVVTASNDNATLPQSIEQRIDRLETQFTQLQQVLKQFAGIISQTYLEETPAEFPESSHQHSKNNTQNTSSPLLDYLNAQHHAIEQEYEKPQIITDSDDLGKLTTIARAFQSIRSFEIDYLQLSKRKLPEHLVLRADHSIAVGFLQIDGGAFTSRVKNWNELVISYPQIQFQLWRDIRLSAIQGKVGIEEIDKLNYSANGEFLFMDQEQRIDFELLYRLITDIQNRDLELEMQEALTQVLTILPDTWICQLINVL